MKTFRKEDVVGKTVIETTGNVKGKVTDVTFDLNGSITLIVKGADMTESQVPVTRVTGISDHVIVKVDQASAGTKCKFCGWPPRQARYGALAAGSPRSRDPF